MLGKHKNALEVLKLAKRFNPEDDTPMVLLVLVGVIYAKTGHHIDEAIEVYKKALEIEPENGAYRDSLGWA